MMPRQARVRRTPALVAAVLAVAAAASLLPSSAHARVPLRGVMVHALWGGVDEQRELALARRLGANVVRVDIGWGSIQPERGHISSGFVHRLDRMMALARRNRLRVIAMLWGSPCWASTAPESMRLGCAGDWWNRGVDRYPPADPNDYAVPARFLTRRYGQRLAALEVWNEPNESHQAFWVTPDPAGQYARLLRVAYRAAKSGNRRVPVLAGSLSQSDAGFLRRLYRLGIRGHYDGLAVHPYSGSAPPTVGSGPFSFRNGLRALRRVQAANRDSRPIWATEFGWTTCAPSPGSYCVSRARQAAYLRAAMRVLDGMRFVRAATVYGLRDVDHDPNDPNSNWGVLDADLRPKPAFAALRLAFLRR